MQDGERARAQDAAFYDSVYGNFGRELAATIRAEAFGEDIGQNSWLTAGELRREEMVIRTGSLGEQVFTPPGVDESLLRAAGFEEIRVEDRTENMAAASAARRRARGAHTDELDRLEGARARLDYDRYLSVVELLAVERRLTRPAYIARKPG